MPLILLLVLELWVLVLVRESKLVVVIPGGLKLLVVVVRLTLLYGLLLRFLFRFRGFEWN